MTTANASIAMKAKFTGQCLDCGGRIAAGETVLYYPAQRGVKHNFRCGKRVARKCEACSRPATAGEYCQQHAGMN